MQRLGLYSDASVSVLNPALLLPTPPQEDIIMMIFTPLFLLVSLLSPVLAQDCKLPSWTIKEIKIKTRDAVGNSGSASFTFTPEATGKAESLSCAPLQGNYRCHIKSKVDPAVEVDLQINTGVAHMSVTQMKFPCGSARYVQHFTFHSYAFCKWNRILVAVCSVERTQLTPFPTFRRHSKSIAGNVDIELACTEPATKGGDISCTSEAGGIVQAVLL